MTYSTCSTKFCLLKAPGPRRKDVHSHHCRYRFGCRMRICSCWHEAQLDTTREHVQCCLISDPTTTSAQAHAERYLTCAWKGARTSAGYGGRSGHSQGLICARSCRSLLHLDRLPNATDRNSTEHATNTLRPAPGSRLALPHVCGGAAPHSTRCATPAAGAHVTLTPASGLHPKKFNTFAPQLRAVEIQSSENGAPS